jgi:L-aspartate oxidase
MWEKAGLLRDAEGLLAARDELRALAPSIPRDLGRASIELRNLHTLGELIVRSALAREESRGAHYRNDFPRRDDVRFRRHSVIEKACDVEFREF